jgi:hypothetical protein
MVFWQKPAFLAHMELNSPIKTKFNFNIDDLSPAIAESDSLAPMFKMFTENKGLKIDAFAIPKWMGHWDIRDYPTWIENVKNLVDMYNLRLCLHGFEHDLRDGRVSEFTGMNTQQCVNILTSAMKVFVEVGLPICKVLRPPRWYMTDYLLEACSELGIDLVCVAWSTAPRRLWNHGLDTVYSNLYHSNSPNFPSDSQASDERHNVWADFSNQVICHAHYGRDAYDSIRNKRIKFPIRSFIPQDAEFIHLQEAVPFRKVMENADPTVQALC